MTDEAKITGAPYRYMMVDWPTAASRHREYDYYRELRIANHAIYNWRFVAQLECEVEAR
jgi:hypothetical protein